MNAHPYLLSVLVFTACSEDSNSQASPGSGGTGTTAGGGGSHATLTGGGNGGTGTTAGGVTAGAATGGGAGEGQGGAAGGGASGAGGTSGAVGGGAGGEGGAAGECVPALHALVRAIFGDFDCPELEACFVESCPNELAAAMGDGWPRGDHSGGICADYADCVDACECESDCSLECRGQHANGGACLDAIIEVSLCRNEACPTATDSCEP